MRDISWHVYTVIGNVLETFEALSNFLCRVTLRTLGPEQRFGNLKEFFLPEMNFRFFRAYPDQP